MKLTPPKNLTFYISIIIAVLGVILYAAGKGAVGFAVAIGGFVLLALANLIKGL